MTGAINSIYNFFAAIFSIPSVCCDFIYSLFSSTVPSQAAKDKVEREPIAASRVIDQTHSRIEYTMPGLVEGLRQRRIGSGSSTSTTTTSTAGGILPQSGAAIQPQPELKPILRDPNVAKPRQQRQPVTFAEGSGLAVTFPQPQSRILSPSSDSTTRSKEGFTTAQAGLVVSPSSHPVIPTTLTDEEMMALAIANSMKKEEDVYVPQVGQKVPLQNFINGFQVGSLVRNKLTDLQALYPMYQPIRGDGNCFYTSFAVDLLSSFRNLSRGEKERILHLVQNCSASDEAKEAVAAGILRLISGQNFGATDQLMLHFVLCVRHIGADYMGSYHDEFFLDEEGILAPMMNMWTMGANTDDGAIRAVAMAFGRSIRIVNYHSDDKDSNYQIAQYYDMAANGKEDDFFWGGVLGLPKGPHPERVFLYSGGHYSLLHKR